MNKYANSPVLEKFLRYVKINTRSSAESETVPSTPGQLELAKILCDDLKKAGAVNTAVTEKGYVYGFLPPAEGLEKIPCCGFVAFG